MKFFDDMKKKYEKMTLTELKNKRLEIVERIKLQNRAEKLTIKLLRIELDFIHKAIIDVA